MIRFLFDSMENLIFAVSNVMAYAGNMHPDNG